VAAALVAALAAPKQNGFRLALHKHSLALEFRHFVRLVVRHHFGNDLVNTCLGCNSGGRDFIIAGQHVDLYAHLLQPADGGRGLGLYLVGNSQDGGQFIINCQVQGCLAGSGKFSCFCFDERIINPFGYGSHHFPVTEQQFPAFNLSLDTFAENGLKRVWFGK
jgi:hypothetical protein